MTDVRLKLAPPWITYVNKVTALLDGDPEIAINYDNRIPSLVIATNNGDKAAALAKLFPEKKVFGKVTLTIGIDGPMSNKAFVNNKELMSTAFKKNPAVSYIRDVEGIITSFTYVVFKNTVVQFFNDNLNDINGLLSTLYQDIAAELFEEANLHGVAYCTEIEDNLGKTLRKVQWP